MKIGVNNIEAKKPMDYNEREEKKTPQFQRQIFPVNAETRQINSPSKYLTINEIPGMMSFGGKKAAAWLSLFYHKYNFTLNKTLSTNFLLGSIAQV